MRKMIPRRQAKCANLSSMAVETMCFDRRGISIRCFSVPAQEGLAQLTTRKAYYELGTSAQVQSYISFHMISSTRQQESEKLLDIRISVQSAGHPWWAGKRRASRPKGRLCSCPTVHTMNSAGACQLLGLEQVSWGLRAFAPGPFEDGCTV